MSVVRHRVLAEIVLMDAVTMVVTCCSIAVFSSCVSIRKRSMLCGRSWSVFVRVFTPMSNTLGLVVVFVVLFAGAGAATCATKTAFCPSHVQQRCADPHLKQLLISSVCILAVALEPRQWLGMHRLSHCPTTLVLHNLLLRFNVLGGPPDLLRGVGLPKVAARRI